MKVVTMSNKTTRHMTPEEVEAWLDGFEPTADEASDASDLRRISEAAQGAEDASEELREAVRAARAKGRSWGAIGVVLGVSKQAARQRFSETQ